MCVGAATQAEAPYLAGSKSEKMGCMTDDVRLHREWLLSHIDLPKAGLIVDLGCGTGEDVIVLADHRPGATNRFVGLDASEKNLAVAREAASGDSRIDFRQYRIEGSLPFPDASVDAVYSNNFVECLPDPSEFAREIARVLLPGGSLVIAYWDWDSQAFDGTDKALIRRLVHAYSDWQQAWMAYADGWMGRRLWGTFKFAGFFQGTVHARVLTNTVYAEPWYGYARAHDFSYLVEKGVASAEDYRQFIGGLEDLQEQGRYFYSITGYPYVGRRLGA